MSLSIVIIGGGMVGAAAALLMAKQGHQVKLVEFKPIEPNHVLNDQEIDVRLSALNLFSESLLAEIGAWQHVLKARKAPYKRLAVKEMDSSDLLFNATDIDKEHLGHLIENKIIQASMWSEFKHYPNIEVISDAGRLAHIRNNTQCTELEFEKTSLTADLVIAADGAGSMTRMAAGIGVTGWRYQQACMGVLIKLDAPQQDITWQQFKPSGPVAFLPMQAPYANLIWYNDASELERLNNLSKDALKMELLANFPSLPGDFTVEKNAVFPLTRQHANQYVKNNVVLVGDAAHAINPLAGQGVNLGFRDVAQLAKSLTQYDLPTALKNYETKRRPVNLLMMSAMDACYAGFSNDIAPLKLMRNTLLKSVNKLTPLKNQILKYAIGEYL